MLNFVLILETGRISADDWKIIDSKIHSSAKATQFHFQSKQKVIKMTLRLTKNDRSPISIAIYEGNMEILKHLVNIGAQLNSSNSKM